MLHYIASCVKQPQDATAGSRQTGAWERAVSNANKMIGMQEAHVRAAGRLLLERRLRGSDCRRVPRLRLLGERARAHDVRIADGLHLVDAVAVGQHVKRLEEF